MRKLYFEQITDDRFDKDIYNLTENICLVDFGDSKQYRCRFHVTKNTHKVNWNDIYKIVNSVKPVPYGFI